MRRHQIMDLYHGHEQEAIGEWESVNNLPNVECCKLKVKLSDDTEIFVYFYSDKAQWIKKFGKTPSHFWDCESKEPIFNVKEWKIVREHEE